MIKEYFNSALKGIKERTQNPFTTTNNTPFAGAYLIALIIYNWEICFSLLNFDSNDKRINKIQILSNYFNNSTVIERLGYPLVIAFLTIIFYYFFNFISLGITTFFTRWFKSTILFLTDRSKNVPRDEFDEFMNKLEITRKKYEEIKKEFSESQSEIELYKEKLRNSTNEINGITIELERTKTEFEEQKNQIQNLNNKLSGFKIISATYGLFSNRIDVKSTVEAELDWGELLVENNKFKQDPIPNILKEIIIVYTSNGEVKLLIANEHDIIKKVNDDLELISSKIGQQKEENLVNKIKAIS